MISAQPSIGLLKEIKAKGIMIIMMILLTTTTTSTTTTTITTG